MKHLIPFCLILFGCSFARATELVSFFDYFEDKDPSNSETKKEMKQYVYEKCSALSFVWIGGDREIFDVGDMFFEEAVAFAGEDN